MQQKTVPLIDGDPIFVNGWETDGDRPQRREIPEFPQILARYDRNHDGKLSRDEMRQSNSAEWFADNDLNHDGYIDAGECQLYRARTASENCLVAIRAGGRGDVTGSHVLWRYRKALPNTSSPLLPCGRNPGR